jgi:CRISPR-associated protein Cas6
MVDAVFALDGQALPREHAQALREALCAQLAWLASEPHAGIHPIKMVLGNEQQALLSRRARLLLRVRLRRMQALTALTGIELDVGGHRVRLGTPHVRKLVPHATVYAYRVASDSADEAQFMAAVGRELAQLEIAGERVCGKHQRMTLAGRTLDAFSLMLHGLAPEQSLRLQQHGLGPHRLWGCGIFVPHKSAAAVGS